MSVLSVQYKAYKAKLIELEKAYQVLNAKHTAVATFVTADQQLFSERDHLRLASVPTTEKLESLEKKNGEFNSQKRDLEAEKGKLEEEIALFKSHLENPELATMEPEDIRQKLLELETNLGKVDEKLQKNAESLVENVGKIAAQRQLVTENEQALIAVNRKLAWVGSGKFDSNYTHGKVSQADFNAYTDALNVAVKLRQELRTIETEISTLVKAPISPLKVKDSYKPGEREALVEAWDTEKAQQIVWAKQNLAPISQRNAPLAEKLLGRYQYALHDAHEAAAAEHLQALGKDKYNTKFAARQLHLNDLEELVTERVTKQNAYRAELPAYAAQEIPRDAHVQGERAYGIGKTDTMSKVTAIKTYLETPFGEKSKEEVTTKLKDLYSKVNVTLSTEAAGRIYDAAVREQGLKAEVQIAPEEQRAQL